MLSYAPGITRFSGIGMFKVQLDEEEFELSGKLLQVGDVAPTFNLKPAGVLAAFLGDAPSKQEVRLEDLGPQYKILNVVISTDTPLCIQSVRYFSRVAAAIQGVVPVVISSDLQFALGRQAQRGLFTGLTVLSAHTSSFGIDYGIQISSGRLKGLLSRALWVLDPANRVIHADVPTNLLKEPNYRIAVKKLIEDQVQQRNSKSS